MKKIIITVIVIILAYAGYHYLIKKDTTEDPIVEQTNVKEEKLEWVSLFDGTTFNGWHLYNGDSIPDSWAIIDGAMVYTPIEDERLESIVTDKNYTDFMLSLEWKISEGGNSGFFWGIYEDKKFDEPYFTGPEIQILDNEKHEDGQYETHRAGSLYDMIAPSELVVNEVGEWNICALEINHKTNTGNVWLNDVHIVNFEVNGDGWDNMVKNSKFKDYEGFGEYPTGKIGLQDHDGKVSFRNLKIKEL